MSFLCEIEPFDTMAFRDGRPFEQNDEGMAETTGVFPSSPPAIAGAVTAAMAATLGVGEIGNAGRLWDALQAEWLGDHDPSKKAKGECLEQIRSAKITSPFLTRAFNDPDANPAILVPSPRDLLFVKTADEKRNEKIAGRLMPRNDAKTTANLPAGGLVMELTPPEPTQLPEARSKVWIELPVLAAHLANPTQLPGSCFETKDLVSAETHIGIAIDKSQGRAIDGMLYAASHQRFQTRKEHKFGIAAFVHGVEYFAFDELVPFGGEGRLARIRSREHPNPFDRQIELPAGRDLRIVALTPVQVSSDKPFGLELPTSVAGTTEVYACVCDRPVAYGFYHPAMSGRAIVVQAYAAGSVWYLHRTDNKKSNLTISISDSDRLGPEEFHSYGFGAFMGGPL